MIQRLRAKPILEVQASGWKTLRRVLAMAAAPFFLSLLGACGQQGPLYLPTEPAAAHRATLPQTLLPGAPRAAQPASEAAAPPAPSASAAR
jgi:predicted small lipoprotein YifL